MKVDAQPDSSRDGTVSDAALLDVAADAAITPDDATSDVMSDAPTDAAVDSSSDDILSFFVSSVGGDDAGNLGGLVGADALCASLATASGHGGRTWAAYLSTSTVNAFDRIGAGPWYNAAGMLVATDATALHASGLAVEAALDEWGETVPWTEHDVLTGANAAGEFDPLGFNCLDFTSNSPDQYVAVGHSDGGGVGQDVFESWNSAHLTTCDEEGLASTAGVGRIYCFAL